MSISITVPSRPPVQHPFQSRSTFRDRVISSCTWLCLPLCNTKCSRETFVMLIYFLFNICVIFLSPEMGLFESFPKSVWLTVELDALTVSYRHSSLFTVENRYCISYCSFFHVSELYIHLV